MNVHLTNCEDRELVFRPIAGRRFPCFWLTAEGDNTNHERLLVCVHPDGTVHLIPFVNHTGQLSSQTIADSVWKTLISAALREVSGQRLHAACVLLPDHLAELRPVFAESDFRNEGIVDHLERPEESGVSVELPGMMVVEADRQELQAVGNTLRLSLIQLLKNTIRNSEESELRLKLNPEGVLNLFLLNPTPLSLLVAVKKNQQIGLLVGNASPETDSGHLEYLGVHSEFRREGIGEHLLDEFQRLIPQTSLSVAVHRRNQASQRFFADQNFLRTEQYELWVRDI